MDIQFCTLATRSHLAYCRVLADSLARVCPGARLQVLVVDGRRGDLSATVTPNTDALELADLELLEPQSFCFQYTAFELCNALKAPLLQFIRRRRPGVPIVYLDSDIYCLGSLDSLTSELATSPVLLTPHTTVDFPDGGSGPGTLALLQSGVFNAGVIGVGCCNTAEAFLSWWTGKLRHHCLRAVSDGIFVDQKFLDLVPCLFPGIRILRDDGLNVAWFNLHARRLSRSGSVWHSNGQPLRLFHFTMFSPMSGAFEASIQPDPLATQPLIRELAGQYRDQLFGAGYVQQSLIPYGFERFADGTPIMGQTRRAFREAWMRGEVSGDPFASSDWLEWQKRFVRQTTRENRLRSWVGIPRRIIRRLL